MRILHGIFITALSVTAIALLLFIFGTVPQIFGLAPSAVYFSILMSLAPLADFPVILYFNRSHGLNVGAIFLHYVCGISCFYSF